MNEIFGNTFKSTPLEITTEDYLALRYRLCDEVLKEGSGLRDYLAKAGEKDAGLLLALFPHRPGAAQVLVPAGEVRVEGQQAVSCAEGVGQKGVVTDLYVCQGNEGWEGYITSPTVQKGQKGAVYRFTSASCACSFPVCLGSTVEFRLNSSHSGSVASSSVRVIHYFPGTLPHEYATEYLGNLVKAGSECLNRVLELPGPLVAILNEAALMEQHHTVVLGILADPECFKGVAEIVGVFNCKFLDSLPHIISAAEPGETTRKNVLRFLRLVSRCINIRPHTAYEMSAVIKSCAHLASTFREEFMSEGPNLCITVVCACHAVRHRESPEDSQLSSVEDTSCAPDLLDPLLWVTHLLGKDTAHSLREHIPRNPLGEEEGGVFARRKLENIVLLVSSTKENTTKVCTKLNLSRSSCQVEAEVVEKTGVVTDLYPRGEGYVVLASGRRGYNQNQRVFKIGLRTTASLDGVPLSVHLGDLVQFQVSPHRPDMVHRVTKIREYSSKALEADFGNVFFSKNKGLDQLLLNEAAIKGILNAPQVYDRPDVCAKLLSTVHDALSDSNASIKKTMLGFLKSSSFVSDLVDMVPEEVSKSVRVMVKYLEHYPDEVCVLAGKLESMIRSLQKQDELRELASFLSFLSTSTCLLPHSVEIARQPWQTIPIILTPDECKAGVVANKEYLPVVRVNYASVHEYGRTYFLLLRADCHSDLASLIHQLREPDSPSRKRDRAVVCDAQVTGFSNQGYKRSLVYHFAVQTRPLPPEDQSRDTPLFKAGITCSVSV